MSIALNDLLNRRGLNRWQLFWLITFPISVAMVVAMTIRDMSTGSDVSSMIQLSVRCAVPWLYLAFAASSAWVLFPGPVSRWLLRNRKYLGMCFAAAMAWQGLFILWLVFGHTDYYVDEVYVLRDAIEGVIGYGFLLAMTITSFPKGRKLLTPKQWRLLHLSGIYFLWAYAFSVYWWALYYYSNPVPLDYIFYWCGLAAWALRTAAWSKKRRKADVKRIQRASARSIFRAIGATPMRVAGATMVAGGLVAASIGSAWQDLAEDYLYGYAITQLPELYLPYWPFEPFLSLAAIMLGVFLFASASDTAKTRTSSYQGAA